MNNSAPDTPEPRFPITEEQLADTLGETGTTLTVEIMRATLERLRLDERLPKHNHPVPPPSPVMHIYCPVCTRTIC